MTPDEARKRAAKLTFDRDMVREIASLMLDAVAEEREACARMVEAGQETSSNTEDGTYLTPRRPGNAAGLAYAAAIRARRKS
jgi:hypothetical protein